MRSVWLRSQAALEEPWRRPSEDFLIVVFPGRCRIGCATQGAWRNLSQADLARHVGVGPSAVAQWEVPAGTSPTVEHLAHIAKASGVSFEWLATGRGAIRVGTEETPAVESSVFARDLSEERLLIAFRRVAMRKRESLVRWLEEFL